jgi:hypothetical protein
MNYHFSLCKIPQERSAHLLGGGSLKFAVILFEWLPHMCDLSLSTFI